MPPREITRLGICRSFQIPQLYSSLSVFDNMMIGLGIVLDNARLAGFFSRGDPPVPGYGKPAEEVAEHLLARFGLSDYRHRNAQVLPGGVRKLLDIALTMVAKPRVLLLDEPTSGVSAEEKFGIMQMVLDAVRAEGATVLFVEHDMEVVSRFAQRVLAFYDGRIIADAPPAVALQDPGSEAARSGARACLAWAHACLDRNLNVSIASVHILRGVSLELPTGSMTGLIGRNGAGKTTLMKTRHGLLKPGAGAVRFDGRDLAAVPTYARARLGIGYMPEDRRLIPDLTVEENILLPAWAGGAADERRALRQDPRLHPGDPRARPAQGLPALGRPAEARRARARPDVRHAPVAPGRAVRGRGAGARAAPRGSRARAQGRGDDGDPVGVGFAAFRAAGRSGGVDRSRRDIDPMRSFWICSAR